MPDEQAACGAHLECVRFGRPLFEVARQFSEQRPIKIVAIGSSSTAGRDPVRPYPPRLETALRIQFPAQAIAVLNKGAGGEEAPLELRRFDKDVVAEQPALVIWQVGTNAAWKGYDLDDVAAAIDVGLGRLRALPMDVVLMDLQYVPALLVSDKVADNAERMVSLIATAAQKAGVNLFRRFALMRRWHEVDKIPVDHMADRTDPDHLHQSDWSTECVAQALCQVIADGAARAAQPMG